MSVIRDYLLCGLLAVAAAALGGCSVQEPPTIQAIAAQPQHPPRLGQVYLVRGLLGVFSVGMDELRDELIKNGVSAVALQHTATNAAARTILDSADEPNARPLIIIGHSLGADSAVAIARRLHAEGHEVDLMITLDPVYAGSVTPNVQEAINFYRSSSRLNLIPLFRGRPLKVERGITAEVRNVDIRNRVPDADHFNIDTNPALQRKILELVLERCPPSHVAVLAGSRPLPSHESSTEQHP